MQNGAQSAGSGEWLGKCLDLSKAYKQLAILPEHRYLFVLFSTTTKGYRVSMWRFRSCLVPQLPYAF